jgi:endoglucanase
MNRKFLSLVLFCWSFGLSAQNIIYADASSKITGTWVGTGIWNLNQVTSSNPYEGINHYRFNYSNANGWAGFGLDLANWGTAGHDFSAFTHFRIAYKGMSSGQTVNIKLRNSSGSPEYSNEVTFGSPTSSYAVVDIPILSFTNGNNFDLTNVTALDISIASSSTSYSGSFYFDDVKLVNITPNTETSLKTWARHAKMDKGMNLSNWLEAYWSIPYNAYPDVNKFNRTKVQTLRNLGFNSFRLPVIFEQIADPNPPYTIDPNHITLRLIDSTIVWANDMNFNLIIDNHHGLPLNNANFQSQIPRLQAIWTQIINRYHNVDPDRVFFEIYNEPQNDITNANLKSVMVNLVDTIRNLNPDVTLIMGGNHWNSMQGLIEFVPLEDENIIYTFHSYEPYNFTHQQLSWTNPPYFPSQTFQASGADSLNLTNLINVARTWSDQNRRPIMLGEFGASTGAPATSRCNYISVIANALRSNGIPWYYWDGVSPVDAFGFINNTNVTQCFADVLKVGNQQTCPLLVTNTNDYGIGSLREQLACAGNGDIIDIATNLAGDTIELHYLPGFVHKNVILRNQHSSPVFLINLESDYPLLHALGGNQLTLDNIDLLAPTDHIIMNHQGTTTLKNLDIYSNETTSEALFEGGNIIIEGNVKVKP